MPEITPADLDAVRELADRAALGVPVAHEPLAGGYANTSYRVFFEDGTPRVLTLVNEKAPDHARATLELQRRLGALDGVPVPSTLAILELGPEDVPAGEDGRPPELAVWKDWITGVVPERLTEPRLTEIGRALAALHELPAAEAPAALPRALDYGPPVWDEARTWDAAHDEFAGWIAGWSERVGATGLGSFPHAVIHFDVDADNTVFHADRPDELRAILDWEEACVDARIWDLASTLCFAHRHAPGWDPALEAALLEGYGARRLSDGEREALRTLTGAAAAAHAFWHYRHGPVRRGWQASEPARDRQALADRLVADSITPLG